MPGLGAVVKFADAQCLPLGLVFAVLIGAAVPVVGFSVGKGGYVGIFCVISLFFIAGLVALFPSAGFPSAVCL